MNSVAAKLTTGSGWIFVLIGASILILYSSVIVRLVRQWLGDENYSHGLLVPIVIGVIIWLERERLKVRVNTPNALLGMGIVLLGFIVLLAGTLGAELFSQRFSLVILIAGVLVYLWGHSILSYLSVPFLLLFLAIPIPQIILNKVTFPLQLFATKAAQVGISLFGIPNTRKGNVIEMLPYGASMPVGLEVVEACSGIRSLITYVTLAVVLSYFGRAPSGTSGGSRPALYQVRDLWRGGLLVVFAVPIALITNAARILLTGLVSYQFGSGIVESWWHEVIGWLTFVAGLLVLLGLNVFLANVLTNPPDPYVEGGPEYNSKAHLSALYPTRIIVLVLLLLGGGVLVNLLQIRTETRVVRKPLAELPLKLGEAFRPFEDARFSPATEKVLNATDYLMREYISPPRRFNLYVGYYGSQSSGSTYHSPQHCLPGAGWEMNEGETIEFTTVAGRRVLANRYIIQNGANRNVMIYWYQGRGRMNASEYWDKLYTVVDSISKGRSDGAMVRVMTPIYPAVETDQDAFEATEKFSRTIADSLGEFVPD